MLSRKAELFLLNLVLLAGITASGVAFYNNNEPVRAASASTSLVKTSDQNASSAIDKTNNGLSSTNTSNRGSACGNGCSNCGACTGNCRF